MAKTFNNGVGFYTEATMTVNFPEDDICCHWCPLLDREFADRDVRYVCKRTGEIVPAPSFMIGHSCPLVFQQVEEL